MHSEDFNDVRPAPRKGSAQQESARGTRQRQSRQPVISATRVRGQKLGQESFSDPINYPEFSSDSTKVKRAWLFMALTFFIPGAVQLITDRKTLGRRALTVTLTVWAVVLLAIVLAVVRRTWLFSLFTHNFTLVALVIALVVLGLGWLYLFLDTLRVIKVRQLPQRAKVPVILGLAAMMLVVGGGIGYTAYVANTGRGALNKIFAGGTDLKEENGRYNILLMGGDAGADRVGRRPDSMTVVSIDADTGQAVTISVPRNTQNAPFSPNSPLWQVYPEGFNCGDECIINALYTDVMQNHQDLYPDSNDPGAEATMDAVSGVLGIEVNNYMLIDMDGFAQLIDALGGITIDVGGRVPIGGGTDLMTGQKNPIDGYIEPGVQKLDGFHALWYARSREGATDYEREARQRCVQAAMLKQMNPTNVLSKFGDIAASGEQIVETNIPENSLSGLADIGLKSKDFPLIQYAAGPPYYSDTFPTYPDFDQLHADVQKVLQDSKDGIQPSGVAENAGFFGGDTSAQGAPLTSTVEIQTVAELSENGTCSVP
ncbi:LCP family protein [Rothia amarae]|uniref:LCP family protein n=1 Tax=Rothia amarae TaxID=169480 RepID=A0A7H2BII7_9MICC|nr:LCP family protein [Rothia amarae]QNV39483.1 LCP family protein [Rothia amarae]